MARVRVKLKRSVIGQPKDQKDTVKALGLKKVNQVVEKENSPQVAGMIRKVSHLLEIEDI